MRALHTPEDRGKTGDLFGFAPPQYPQTPGFKASPASRDAATRIGPHAATVRGRVLAEYVTAGPRGLTADECAKLVGESILTTRPRVSELHAAGLVEPTEERRVNDSRMSATVWRATAEAEHA